MGYKSARENFSKEDILDILKRNVSLYKDEKEFVDYIVNLAMFLIDSNYGSDRISPWEAPPPPGVATPTGPSVQASAGAPPQPPPPSPNAPILPELSTGKMAPPSADEIRRRRQSASLNAPMSENFHEPSAPKPFNLTGAQEPSAPPPAPAPPTERVPIARPAAPPAAPLPAASMDEIPLNLPGARTSGIYQVKGGLSTPAPDAPKSREVKKLDEPEGATGPSAPKINVQNDGRTRVYRVVRAYRSSTAIESPCPVCGQLVPAEAPRCLACGHLM